MSELGHNDIASIVDGLLYQKLRLYVPKGLQQAIMQSEHNSRVAGHFGQDKTIELINVTGASHGLAQISSAPE